MAISQCFYAVRNSPSYVLCGERRDFLTANPLHQLLLLQSQKIGSYLHRQSCLQWLRPFKMMQKAGSYWFFWYKYIPALQQLLFFESGKLL